MANNPNPLRIPTFQLRIQSYVHQEALSTEFQALIIKNWIRLTYGEDDQIRTLSGIHPNPT